MNYYNNNNNGNGGNSFSQENERNYTDPIVVETAGGPQRPEEPEKKKKSGTSRGAVALIVCSCIVFSSLFGFGGAYLAMSMLSTGAPSASVGGQASSGQAQGTGGRIYQSIGSENSGLLDTDNAMVNAVGAAYSSIVEISTETVATSAYFGQYVTEGAGSGVIISKDGYIVTCAHVISGATNITVTTADGTKYQAKAIGADNQTDIAVLKIEAENLAAAVIGNSDKITLGETAIAIGNPLGELGGTVTNGIISALDREISIDGQNYTLLQTNAAINPGNSGGGLFNINGELIGIVNAKSSGSEIEGLGFAIPVNEAVEIADQLISYGYIKGRVMLGVYIYEVNSSTSSYSLYNSGLSALVNYITDYGVYFVEYQSGQSGDLKLGDRIVAIDGTAVSSKSDITSVLGDYEVGDKVTVTVARLTGTGRQAQSKMVDIELTLLENVPNNVNGTSAN